VTVNTTTTDDGTTVVIGSDDMPSPLHTIKLHLALIGLAGDKLIDLGEVQHASTLADDVMSLVDRQVKELEAIGFSPLDGSTNPAKRPTPETVLPMLFKHLSEVSALATVAIIMVKKADPAFGADDGDDGEG